MFIVGNSWPVLCRKMKNSKVSLLPVKLLFKYKNFLPQVCAVTLCWGNYLWWPLSPFLNYSFPRQKLVEPALGVPCYLMLRLTIQSVLLFLCDHLPSDSGLPVTVTWLLSILFDLISCWASKIFVALAHLLKTGGKNQFLVALCLKLHSWLFSWYELPFEIHLLYCLLDPRSWDLKSETEWYWLYEKYKYITT